MDSDIVLKDDGTAEISGDRFKASVSDIEMYYRGGHLKTVNELLELSSDSNTLKLNSSNLEMYYCGGHLKTANGNLELTSDSNTLKLAASNFEMYYRGGNGEETARALQVPVGTIKSRVYRALRMLRAALEEQGVVPR